jgi:hypothetical protein
MLEGHPKEIVMNIISVINKLHKSNFAYIYRIGGPDAGGSSYYWSYISFQEKKKKNGPVWEYATLLRLNWEVELPIIIIKAMHTFHQYHDTRGQ